MRLKKVERISHAMQQGGTESTAGIEVLGFHLRNRSRVKISGESQANSFTPVW